MGSIDVVTAKYRLSRLAREFDTQTFIASIEELYDGEAYKVVFQRGYHSYVQEIEGDRFAAWLADEEDAPDMVEVVKLAVEELTT